jgi:hypothetical protein
MPFSNLNSEVTNEEFRENATYSWPWGKKTGTMADIVQHV